MSFGQTPVSTTPLGTNQFPVSAVQEPGQTNLTALEGGPGSVDGNNNRTAPASMYVKDGGDVAAGTTTDTAYAGSGAASRVSVLKGIFNKLAGILGIQQADLTATGTISAAQPVIGTPVTNATVQLALGQGQSSWMAQLVAGAGFTSATTIVVDQSIDGGTTWFVTNFKVSGSLTNTPVQSIVGPGPLLLSGDAASKGIIRIRCSVLNASETINVTLRSGAGVGSVGLLSSIPAGSNNIGSVNVANANNNGQNVMANSSPVAIASDQSNVPIKGGFAEQVGLSAGALNADLVPSTDVSAYKWLSLHISGNAYVGTLSFQCSNDNVDWRAVGLNISSGASVNASLTSVSSVLYHGPVFFRYFRVRMTSYTSGAANGTLELYTEPCMIGAIGIGSNGGSVGINSGQNITLVPATSGGLSDFHLISAASTNANNIKASAGQVYGYDIGNNGASDAYVKLYNTAGAPTAGAGTPIRTIYVPKGGSKTLHISDGVAFATGIGITITGGAADSDVVAVGAAQVTVELDYK